MIVPTSFRYMGSLYYEHRSMGQLSLFLFKHEKTEVQKICYLPKIIQ